MSDELNPYASPVADCRAAAVVPKDGPWRYGTLLVLHEDADLPGRCIKTGRPAEVVYACQLDCRKYLGWSGGWISLKLPMTRQAVLKFVRARRRVFGVTFVLMSVPLAVVVWHVPLRAGLTLGAVAQIFVAIGAALVTSVLVPELLHCRRYQRPFLWVEGAGARYLASLPEWPGD
jgi:hypothetical protein